MIKWRYGNPSVHGRKDCGNDGSAHKNKINNEGDQVMPKMKTHSGAKRFRLIASGKIKRAKQNKNHILNKEQKKKAQFKTRRICGCFSPRQLKT